MKLFWTFFRAWARVQWARIAGYEILAPPQVSEWRWKRGCEPCPFFDGAQCQLCHCMAQAKVIISVERCPINKWGPRWVKRGE